MKMTENGKTISMVLDVNSALQRLKTGKMKKTQRMIKWKYYFLKVCVLVHYIRLCLTASPCLSQIKSHLAPGTVLNDLHGFCIQILCSFMP